MSFIRELKRRNVFRVGIAYVIVAWLLLQVADLVLENIDAPGWIMQVFMLALAIGLPLALIFAWAFEMTPEGLKREREVDRSQSITHLTGRKLDRAIIVVLALALAYFAWDKWVRVPSGADSRSAVAGQAGSPQPAEDAARERAIAVLPFANRSAREEDAFFAEGIHDDLLTSLAKVGSLKVISRTSVMRYRDTDLSIPEIARELGVTKVLEGGIQRSANQVRINVQLIDAETDEHLWAENYDRELTAESLFAIQSEISREIVNALRATLSDEESARLAAVPTTSLEAYGEFVLGRQELARRSIESLERARAHFETAIELDADYALAWVGLADAWALLANYGDLMMADSFDPRQAAIDRALAIDPDLGEAYTSLGNLRSDQFRNEEAEEYFLKAMELSPNYATAYHWYALMLGEDGRDEEALPLVRKALELDPLAPILTTIYAGTLWDLGRVEEAQAVLRKGIEANPDFQNYYGMMSERLRSLGRIGEALQWNRRQQKLTGTHSFTLGNECQLHLDLGDDHAAEACFDAFEEAYPQSSLGWRGLLYQYRGQYDLGLQAVREWAAVEQTPGSREALAWNYLNVGEADKARELVEGDHAELYGAGEVTVRPSDLGEVTQAGIILTQQGERERADYLFDQVLATMQTMHRTRGEGYGGLDVWIHVWRGDKQKAIVALREAVASGWRAEWWRLRHPLFDTMLDEPEWIDLMTELEADIARQRQWYENHKNDPVI